MNKIRMGVKLTTIIIIVAASKTIIPHSLSAEWSDTEIHWQRGKLEAPSFAGGAKATTNILTLQHASGWRYGDNFFFADFSRDNRADGFNDNTSYMELYSNFSYKKIIDDSFSFGLVKDIGFIAGLNIAPDSKVKKYLPGLRLSWDLPGFAFINTDVTAYIDHSEGLSAGGAPAEDDSYMLDINFALPFQLGDRHRFSVEGHVEYISSRDNELGSKVSHWILAQPQLRYDLGHRLWQQKDELFVGLEYQYWRNKLGAPSSDESELLLLLVWQL